MLRIKGKLQKFNTAYFNAEIAIKPVICYNSLK